MHMNEVRIILVGQPNVGKSSLLNAIVGPRVIVSNYPGTTIELTKAEKIIDDTRILFIDTPGIYSLSASGEEERITKRILFEEDNFDGIVVVADATALERSLYIVINILEAGIPVIIALNFVEDAEKKGIKINYKKLENILGIPVIPINPLTKKGLKKFLNIVLSIKQMCRQSFLVRYDDHIEKAIDMISKVIFDDSRLPKRVIALKILEEDIDFYRYIRDERVVKEAKKFLGEHHPNYVEDIYVTRYGLASLITEKVTRIIPVEEKRSLEDALDNVFFHRIWGPIATTLFFTSVFLALLLFGNWIQGILMGLSENLLSSLGLSKYFVASIILTYGLKGLIAGISIALPYVFIFYLLLGLLEDIGLLPRFLVSIDRFMKKIGLPGNAFIPLTLGLGCSVPAVRATRIQSSRREQFTVASFLSFVPCSSRTAILMGIVGYYAGLKWMALAFTTIFIAGFIWAFARKSIFGSVRKPLFIELPPYRRPILRNVLAKSWIRMKDFIYIVIPLLILGGLAYSIIEIMGFTSFIVKPLSPLMMRWLELPGDAAIPLIFGFLQKDLTGAMLLTALGTNLSDILTPLQIYVFGVAASIGIPCINAWGIFIKEFGFRKATAITLITIIYGIFIAGIFWRIIFLIGYLL